MKRKAAMTLILITRTFAFQDAFPHDLHVLVYGIAIALGVMA